MVVISRQADVCASLSWISLAIGDPSFSPYRLHDSPCPFVSPVSPPSRALVLVFVHPYTILALRGGAIWLSLRLTARLWVSLTPNIHRVLSIYTTVEKK